MPWVNTTTDEGLAGQMYSYRSDVLDAQFDVALDNQGISYFGISAVSPIEYPNGQSFISRNFSPEFLAMYHKATVKFMNSTAMRHPSSFEIKSDGLLLVMPVYNGDLIQEFFEIVFASDVFPDDEKEFIISSLLKIRSPWEYHARCHEYELALKEAIKNKKQLELARFCGQEYFKDPLQLGYIKLAIDAYDACSTMLYTRAESLQLNRECAELCDAYLNDVSYEVDISKLVLTSTTTTATQVDTQQLPTYSEEDCKGIEKSLLSVLLSIDTERTPEDNARISMLLAKMLDRKNQLKISAKSNVELVLTLAQQNVAQAQELAKLRAQLPMEQQQVSPASTPQSVFGAAGKRARGGDEVTLETLLKILS